MWEEKMLVEIVYIGMVFCFLYMLVGIFMCLHQLKTLNTLSEEKVILKVYNSKLSNPTGGE